VLQYKIRTLLILMAVVPPAAWLVWLGAAYAIVALIMYIGCTAIVKRLWLSDQALLYRQ
jgi:hypothetical protein